ncbi:hypothetical protein RI367_007085 [Sorochytrium milnesiophthora]
MVSRLYLLLSMAALLARVAADAPAVDCIASPSDPSCSSFVYPTDKASADVASLCAAMPYMPGCSVDKLCSSGSTQGMGSYCDKFSVIQDVCVSDPGMSMMKGCMSFNMMCPKGNATEVKQCTANGPVPGIPGTKQTWDEIQSVCKEMTMDGCDACQAKPGEKFPNCDLLGTYSKLCIAMPDMSQCGEWKAMCKSIPGSALCAIAASGDNPPAMKMYFHGGITDYLLFKMWVPRTDGQYAGACIASILIGVALELLKLLSVKLEAHWMREKVAKSVLRVDIPRTLIAFVLQVWGYGAMLLAMSFNTGIFFCVCAGIALGAGVCRRFHPIGVTPTIEMNCC